MAIFTLRAVSCDDELGAALDDALGTLEAKADRLGAVLTSLSHQVTPRPSAHPPADTPAGTAFTVSLTALASTP